MGAGNDTKIGRGQPESGSLRECHSRSKVKRRDGRGISCFQPTVHASTRGGRERQG
ncbi:hypothetical protein HBI56_204110 [Parastagonospora nodorum]|uniref:Uncharacterized protein n=1 Tax=Phaeosphaeria nodorum (strain SN15 / ATCC MYA-4574 / FGSC 10173) TaxID=321614 RepID=A0A7U2FC86_PHANO|nr:hypothetical protein HBH56_141940 [Parastagonospora nodorum]QRD01614.1 hypothetical protein JI435_122490 [Parastagonospora nodorum SN15]KAH3927541.1 hypothetical protein HBH54_147130 [Parastagonospora nodorum]KAH3947777.1 hypothetical protein HBH53_107210 [Parastagonospora nodorum]KAH3961943.1 hypothetical protein HBH51_179810 [Parastagonospora nodorum]